MESAVYAWPFGYLKITEDNGAVILIEHTDETISETVTNNPVLNLAYKELLEYAQGKRTVFSFPIAFKGTDFQKRVWTSLLKIPYAKTCSYKDIAVSIGSEKAFRAVGMAIHKNPLPFVIPCHRVIGSDGSMLGYAYGLKLKESLLKLEKENNK